MCPVFWSIQIHKNPMIHSTYTPQHLFPDIKERRHSLMVIRVSIGRLNHLFLPQILFRFFFRSYQSFLFWYWEIKGSFNEFQPPEMKIIGESADDQGRRFESERLDISFKVSSCDLGSLSLLAEHGFSVGLLRPFAYPLLFGRSEYTLRCKSIRSLDPVGRNVQNIWYKHDLNQTSH